MNAVRSLRWVCRLMYKDLYVLRGTLLFIMVLSVGVPFLAARLDQGWLFMTMWSSIVAYQFAITSCALEDRVDGWTWMRTLPVSSGTMMAAKYIANLVVAGAGAGIVTALAYFSAVRGWMPPAAVPIYYYTLLPIPLVLCLDGIVFWLSARWDYRRAQMAMFAFLIVIMLLPSLWYQALPPKPLWAAQWATASTYFHLSTWAWLFFAGLLGLYAGLGWLAARAFARRDL